MIIQHHMAISDRVVFRRLCPPAPSIHIITHARCVLRDRNVLQEHAHVGLSQHGLTHASLEQTKRSCLTGFIRVLARIISTIRETHPSQHAQWHATRYKRHWFTSYACLSHCPSWRSSMKMLFSSVPCFANRLRRPPLCSNRIT